MGRRARGGRRGRRRRGPGRPGRGRRRRRCRRWCGGRRGSEARGRGGRSCGNPLAGMGRLSGEDSDRTDHGGYGEGGHQHHGHQHGPSTLPRSGGVPRQPPEPLPGGLHPLPCHQTPHLAHRSPCGWTRSVAQRGGGPELPSARWRRWPGRAVPCRAVPTNANPRTEAGGVGADAVRLQVGSDVAARLTRGRRPRHTGT